MKNKFFKSFCAVATVTLIFGCNQASKKAEAQAALEQARKDSIEKVELAEREAKTMEILANLPEEPIFDILTDLGMIQVKLYSKTPKHRDNFAKLALSGYYNNLIFHRVMNGFMIQGGDPNTRDTSAAAVAKYGQGGPGYTIPAEFVPEYTHKKGALAAARRGDVANPMKESSGSQFYLVQNAAACAHLDGEYTVFGETISGLEVIDRIAMVETDPADRPIKNVTIRVIKLDQASKPNMTE